IPAGAEGTAIDNLLFDLEHDGQSPVILAVGDEPAAIIGLRDELRPEARDAVAALHEAGIQETIMLTGDRREVAVILARSAGVNRVEAELLPDQKVEAIERLLREYDRVGMVGDGVNDAPALARSTVGIAMGAAGTDTALETADVALMGDDLNKVSDTIRLSKRTRKIIAQNIGLALGIKALVLALAVFGLATLWQAILADVGASLVVILNGMRLLRQPREASETLPDQHEPATAHATP
ncbi:MAG: HAD-IC family P-type ATPase, partial [Chloroflexota bacterium]